MDKNNLIKILKSPKTRITGLAVFLTLISIYSPQLSTFLGSQSYINNYQYNSTAHSEAVLTRFGCVRPSEEK